MLTGIMLMTFQSLFCAEQVIVLFPNLLIMRNQSDTLHLPSGKAHAVHRQDVRNSLIKLLCGPSEPEDRTKILVADSLGIAQLMSFCRASAYGMTTAELEPAPAADANADTAV